MAETRRTIVTPMNRQELTISFCGDIMVGAEVGERVGTSSLEDWLSG